MIDGRNRPELEIRGIEIPDGMGEECVLLLEKLFVDFEREEFDGFAGDAAVKAFLIVQSSKV